MSELRLYLRRDSLQEGTDCNWALLDDSGLLQSSGPRLEDLPKYRRCRLVLASELALTVKVQLPDLPERRLVPLLPAAAEAASLLEADAIHAVVLQRGEGGEAILAVVEDSWLGRILSKLAGLGLHPDDALPEYLLLPWTEGDWSVGWRVSDSLARLGNAEGATLDDGDPPIGLTLALAQRTLPGAVKVYQGSGVGTPDWGRWRDALPMVVEPAGPWDWRTAPWPDLPGLLQGKYSPGRNRLDWTRLVRPLAWGVAALVGIHVAGMTLDWAILASENAHIQREMKLLAEKALPAHAAVVDPAWQVSEQIQRLHAAAGNPASDDFLGLLGRLGQAWPLGGGNRIQAVNYDGSALTVSLAQADASWLAQLKLGAAARGLTVSSQDEKDKGVQLNISLKDKGGSRGQ